MSAKAQRVTGSLRRVSPRLLAATAAAACVLSGCGVLVRQATIAYIAIYSEFSPKSIQIEIYNAFIAQFRNRISIHTALTVDKAMSNPVNGALDGDLHFAGRAPQVALPIVAEIANAGRESTAVALVHQAEGTGVPLRVSGVWRIWPEHPGSATEDQGQPLSAFTSYKPDHVFEIHPITRIGDIPLLGTFVPIDGFKPGGAQRTFRIYEAAPCSLSVTPSGVRIVTSTGLYNDVEFIMTILPEPQLVVADGRFVFASASDLDSNVLVKRLRMVFAKGTFPELAVRHLRGGARLHVYGIPRLDFEEISRRVHGSRSNAALLTLPLPYEMIILGVYLK